MVCKPGSVIDGYSSGTFITKCLKQPTRISGVENTCKKYVIFLFGLAPGGVYLCRMMLPYTRCALTAPFHPFPNV